MFRHIFEAIDRFSHDLASVIFGEHKDKNNARIEKLINMARRASGPEKSVAERKLENELKKIGKTLKDVGYEKIQG